MLASHASYNLDFRLRHAELGYRWVVETAIPVSADDGRFGGFEHHAVDIHDRTALSERLADRLARKRSLLQSHAAFAAALANEVEQLPKVQMKSTLDAFAAVTRDPMLRRSTSKPVDVWLGEVVDAACAAMPLGKTLPMLLMPAEPLEINLDCRALSAAMTNALVCTAVLGKEPLSPEQAAVRAVRVDSALFVDLPALPGSSAFVLLDIALRACGLPAGQVSHATDGERRWRVALPLAEPRRGQLR